VAPIALHAPCTPGGVVAPIALHASCTPGGVVAPIALHAPCTPGGVVFLLEFASPLGCFHLVLTHKHPEGILEKKEGAY
jgi:hypothetical protein